MFYIPERTIQELLEEDLHLLDMTTQALGIEKKPGRIDCFPKRSCVVAGVEEAERVFACAGAHADILAPSGSRLEAGDVCLRVTGTAGALHAACKVAQNVMEYSSGIATRCAAMVDAARSVSPHVEVAVTRKHFPGGKRLSLKAALAGGASIHRTGLSDSILVFDQHRVFAGGAQGFARMIGGISARYPEKKIAAEANDPDEAALFARAGADVIQCERFTYDDLRRTVRDIRAIRPSVKVSAAGGVNADNAVEFAATGVDILVTSWVYFGKPEDIKMRFVPA